MRPLLQIRAAVAALVLAGHSPLDMQTGHLGIALFIGRLTRVAAAQQFDPTKTDIRDRLARVSASAALAL
jgi:hypothetical protein